MAYNGNTSKRNGGGPIWAIFDADTVERIGWDPNPLYVGHDGYFFSGDTVAELARNIDNEYQSGPMPPDVLEETVSRYNSFVDLGSDPDFGKPTTHAQDPDASFLCGLDHAHPSRLRIGTEDEPENSGHGL